MKMELSSAMPDRYGTMLLDRHHGYYQDAHDGVRVTRRTGSKNWLVTERGPDNNAIFHTRHRNLIIALAEADTIVRRRQRSH